MPPHNRIVLFHSAISLPTLLNPTHLLFAIPATNGIVYFFAITQAIQGAEKRGSFQ